MPAVMPKKKPANRRTFEGAFAARLRDLRLKADMSPQDLVAALAKQGIDMSYPSVLSWENGHRLPNVKVVFALAKVYGLKPAEVIG